MMPMTPQIPPWIAKLDPEELEEMMANPSWEEVEGLLRNEITLSYKIDIETDSTIKFDQDAERDARVQFLQAAGGFLESAIKIENPDLGPLLAKMLMFGVRGFKVGKELESAFELAIHKLEKDAKSPQQKPNPEMMKIQSDVQLRQQEMQQDLAMKQQDMQNDLAIQQQKSADEQKRLEMQAQVDAHQGQVDAAVEKFKIELQGQLDMAKAKLESETRIAVAQISAKAGLQQAAMGKGVSESGGPLPEMSDLINTVVEQLKDTLGSIQESNDKVVQAHQQTAQAVSKPRQVVRDPQTGDIVGLQ